jgi:hypothetical protein
MKTQWIKRESLYHWFPKNSMKEKRVDDEGNAEKYNSASEGIGRVPVWNLPATKRNV